MHGNAEAGRGEPPSDTRGERRDEVGIGDHERRDQELRQAQDDAAFEAERGQLAVDEAHAVTFGRYEKVLGGCEGLQTCAFRKGRMATARDAREAFVEQRMDQDASRRFDGKADREIRLAIVEQVERLGPAEDTAHPHIEARSLDSEPRQQRRQQDEGGVVGHRHRDRAIGRRGIEHIRLQHVPHEAKRRRHGACKVIGARRRLHAGRRPDEEFVLEHLAQAGERTAHRRLAQADAPPCMRDVALGVESVERLQQVQVEAGDIHRTLIGHSAASRGESHD